jgi:2-hydroxychromene-2-carboxylate isomerase
MLPMVTRGRPVPPEKERYIVLDTAREARLWGIPFGKIIDPCALALPYRHPPLTDSSQCILSAFPSLEL